MSQDPGNQALRADAVGREPLDHRLAAVLWDMDGTLVDSEPHWIATEHALVEAHGGVWTDAHAHALVGNPLLVSADYIREHGGVELPSEEIVELLLDGVISRMSGRLPWRPGARALLEEILAAGIPCALVTMSYRRFADAILAGLPVGSFQAVVTGDEVTHGKPHPEPYLTAAARLGVDPRDCLVIEDSATGIASGEAAGATVVGVPHVVAIPAAPNRTLVDSLEELDLGTLRSLLAAGPIV